MKKILQFFIRIKKNESVRLLILIICIILFSSFLVWLVERKANTQFTSLWDAVWWAVVTATTTGYGDKVPITHLGRILAILTMFLGISIVGIVSGRIASIWVERALREGRKMADLSLLKNHFVILGWKQNMPVILNEILVYNPHLVPENIVIVANIDQDKIEYFRQHYPQFQDIHILRGEHYSEVMLDYANVKLAKRIMIFADESSGTSSLETDSKTVMAAMSLREKAQEAYICAELLDRKFEAYLKDAYIDEIIFSTEYSRMIIANSASSIGMSKIINDLLDVRTEALIYTEDIPSEFVGRKFTDLKSYFVKNKRALLIGLLENVGSFYTRRREAIREAQKTPDISKLVSNLKQVRKLENNRPNINPEEDYVIPIHSLAILIERRSETGVQSGN